MEGKIPVMKTGIILHKSMESRLIKSFSFYIYLLHLPYLIPFPVAASAKEEDFGLIRPSLIRQLRAILDQYPDDGQILKVRSVEKVFT